MLTNHPSISHTTLIVGQGIAGTLLAFRLWQQNQAFMIFDRDSGRTSSAVASGLINPVVVKNFGLTWMAHTLVPKAETFYRYIEDLTGALFYHPLSIFRIFQQPEQAELWNRRRVEEDAESFMSRATTEVPQGIHAPFGGGWIHRAARVDVEIFMEATRRFFRENNLITEAKLDIAQLQPISDGWHYDGKIYGRVVFCQGAQSRSNPWLQELPVNPLKGQLIRIRSAHFSQEYALSRKIFVLPQGGDSFKVGATWEHNLQEGTTPEAENHLLQKITELTDPTAPPPHVEVTGRYYGFRPTVPDRRPLLGQHPDHPGLFVFNGLGSKGYMLAPWLSQHLCEHIFSQKELMREVDVGRYLKEM